MSLLVALRRSALRHPLAWALGLALMLLGGQAASTLHELSHAMPAGGTAVAGAPNPGVAWAAVSEVAAADPGADLSDPGSSSRGSSSNGNGNDNSKNNRGDCPRCLAGAALTGAATAPRLALHFGQAAPGFVANVVHTPLAPRFTRFYAPRAPPLPLRTA